MPGISVGKLLKNKFIIRIAVNTRWAVNNTNKNAGVKTLKVSNYIKLTGCPATDFARTSNLLNFNIESDTCIPSTNSTVHTDHSIPGN
jgi:hypothetical protein